VCDDSVANTTTRGDRVRSRMVSHLCRCRDERIDLFGVAAERVHDLLAGVRGSVCRIAGVNTSDVSGDRGTVAAVCGHFLGAADCAFDRVAFDQDIGDMRQYFLLLASDRAKYVDDGAERRTRQLLDVRQSLPLGVEHGARVLLNHLAGE